MDENPTTDEREPSPAEAAAEEADRVLGESPEPPEHTAEDAVADMLVGEVEEAIRRVAGDRDPLTPNEVAKLFSVSPKTVTRWTKDGRLTCLTTPGRHRRFRRADIAKVMIDNHRPAD